MSPKSETIASKLASGGYKVAIAARSVVDGVSEDGILNVQADLSDPHTVPTVFQTVIQRLGTPNVVVYNVADRQTTPPDDPLSAPLEVLEKSLPVGVDSAYVAAQEALRAFKTPSPPDGTPTAFIYTGNTLNQIPAPGVMPVALAKTAAALIIGYAANAYGTSGYRFYYADERRSDGRSAALDLDGAAYPDMYWQLAHETKQSKWLVTFTKGEWRRNFEGVDQNGETRASYDRRFGST